MVLTPNPNAAPHMQQGAALYNAGSLTSAKEAFHLALQSQPELTIAKFNLGIVCRDLEQNSEASDWFKQVLDSGEITAETWNNLGILAVREERYEEGVSRFQNAIRCKQDFALAHFNLGTLLLRLGRWIEGFREYEWRWRTPGFQPLGCPHPQWDGQPLDGTLLLHTEQGIGDTFQFARFIPEIRKRCRRLIFVRPDSLACMFTEGDWADEVRSPGQIEMNSFDATLPLMSAPFALKLDIDQLPTHQGYLTPETRSVDLNAVEHERDNLRVGFSWCGSPTYAHDRFRSMQLEKLSELLRVPNVSFFSLQMGPRVDEIKHLPGDLDFIHDLSDRQRDFADTAAIARQLDLLISVDTSVLHLGGAMGIPTWGLLSRRSDWRWLGQDQLDSPWYQSVRLYRQKTLDNWEELVHRVAVDLQRKVERRGER